MSTFTLDTSGCVSGKGGSTWYGNAGPWVCYWEDLDPFTQGYVEALMQSLDAARMAAYRAAPWGSKGREVPIRAAFSWLAPGALALILKDCREVVAFGAGEVLGREFWRIRQEGKWSRFPPLTPHPLPPRRRQG